jgi:hypothetical protein
MVGREDYALFYRTACNIFEESFDFINKTDKNYFFMNVASIKLFKHLNTTEMLMTNELDFNYVEKGFTYYDISSVIALLRVSYENLVTIAYHYFDDEINEDRLKNFKLYGYENRRKNDFNFLSIELEGKIKEEKVIIDDLKSSLQKNNFNKTGNSWKPCGWYQLGKKLGLPEFICSKYSFWSSHTHTGFDSLMQVNTSHNSATPKEEIERNKINYHFMCGLLAYFIIGYVNILKRLEYPDFDNLDVEDVELFTKYMGLLDEAV